MLLTPPFFFLDEDTERCKQLTQTVCKTAEAGHGQSGGLLGIDPGTYKTGGHISMDGQMTLILHKHRQYMRLQLKQLAQIPVLRIISFTVRPRTMSSSERRRKGCLLLIHHGPWPINPAFCINRASNSACYLRGPSRIDLKIFHNNFVLI